MHCHRYSRRELLHQMMGGIPALALSGMMASESRAASGNPLSPKGSALVPKAKSVIFLYMYGGPSQVDTFDYKPSMYGMDGKTIEVKTFGRGGHRNQGRIVEPRWKFKQYGECDKWVSSRGAAPASR